MLSKRLKELRKLNNDTQKSVAKAIGITERGYQNYETEQRQPTVEILTKLANYFNVTSDYLLGLSDIPNPKFFVDNPELNFMLQELLHSPTHIFEALKEMHDEKYPDPPDPSDVGEEINMEIVEEAIKIITSPLPLEKAAPVLYSIIKSVRIDKDGNYDVEFK